MLAQALHREATCDGQAAGVVGYGDVGVAMPPWRLDHLRQRVMPIAGRGVHVQITTDVAALDQARDRVLRRALDLVAPFPDLGRNILQPQEGVDALFAREVVLLAG